MAFRFFFVKLFDGPFSSCFGLGKENVLKKSFVFLQRSNISKMDKILNKIFISKISFNFPSSLIGSSWIAQVK
jgi:hypothetical protein